MTLDWQPSKTHEHLLAAGYVITAEARPYPQASQHERWYVATSPDGKCVASGYSEDGLAKCKLFCDRHAERSNN